MAGIGFRLRELTKTDTWSGLLLAYGFAGVIGSGPWVLSIVGILLIGILNTENFATPYYVGQFQISVTYLMAGSLILTSPLQLMVTRFIADRLFEKQDKQVLPNLTGAIFLVITVSGTIAGLCLVYLSTGSVLYKLLMLCGLVILSTIWIVVIVLSGLKAYAEILLAFLVGYGFTVLAAMQLGEFGLEGLLSGFILGHAILLFMLVVVVFRSYSSEKLIAFDFLRRGQVFPSLAITGVLYNLAIWSDKFIFWFNPLTSVEIIAPLRGSPIYDIPIFLAYLSIIPGMAVFLLRMETDFVEQYTKFYAAINGGAPLKRILQIYEEMIVTIRRGFLEIFKVQGMTVVILLAVGDQLLAWVGISPFYRVLLNIDLVAVGVQVLLLAVLNILFYFDYRKDALYLCLLCVTSNILFTLLSQYLGPAFYGYGFALSVVLTTLVGMTIVSKRLSRLVYETFMLR
ncbi:MULTISPECIES: exopolysaccharide Pel transporter PelG [unclassified Nitrosospira]|uniref:exopolysaccharide Pel transporter PelG n=1 Tax=unclassified Nitrosospira TaxID=2609267 RepID=UPI000D31544E|nr:MULTISPECIES: exopolysaccharide Pel transporter PelG [unclassified Nitrosospira]PTR17700.1 putative membrane protein [Nitrosospira sp. Nsp2]WON74002.1 exopolysaccharide Pel transporter PelG [Nitrosospira sp. Is2]